MRIVSGEHAFVAPDFANGDIRGPCPGLNVLSNHGYLPHNGVGTASPLVNNPNFGLANVKTAGTIHSGGEPGIQHGS
jgi:hypothetical protein